MSEARELFAKSLFGRKRGADAEQVVDIAAGVSRALKQSAAPAASAKPQRVPPQLKFALKTIEQALFAIDETREILEEACEVALQARELDDEIGRALLAERYDELRLSIDAVLTNAASPEGDLLSASARPLDLGLAGAVRFTIGAHRLDIGPRGLDLPPPREAFEEIDEVLTVLDRLDRALVKIDRAADQYCRDATFLHARAALAPGSVVAK
ncbi:MAG: hypothetical protein AAFV51_06370 [Pseudomonadota bacterium]